MQVTTPVNVNDQKTPKPTNRITEWKERVTKYYLLNVNQATSKQTCIFGLREDVANLEKNKETAEGKAIHNIREAINNMINAHH